MYILQFSVIYIKYAYRLQFAHDTSHTLFCQYILHRQEIQLNLTFDIVFCTIALEKASFKQTEIENTIRQSAFIQLQNAVI